jgi:hypothetical protein
MEVKYDPLGIEIEISLKEVVYTAHQPKILLTFC